MKRWIISLLATGAVSACNSAPDGLPAINIEASLETMAVAGSGDAADDPAVWRAPETGNSLILGTDKTAGLYAFNLDGSVHTFLPVGRLNNVDVRYGIMVGGRSYDIAAATDRTNIALAIFLIDPETREVNAAPGGLIPLDFEDPYGMCLYRSPVDNSLYAFVNDQEPSTYVQLRIEGSEGGIVAEEVRRFVVGSQPEGCVADDRTGRLYVGEEAIGIWEYGAEPDAGDERTLFATADGQQIVADVEGLALLPRGDAGGYLFASSQGDSAYAVFDLDSGTFINRFRISGGRTDATTETDGIEVFSSALGPDFPEGVFIAQDDIEDSGGQNFKIVDLRDVMAALELD